MKSLKQAIEDNRARHQLRELRRRMLLRFYDHEDRGRARQACRIIDRINKRLKGERDATL